MPCSIGAQPIHGDLAQKMREQVCAVCKVAHPRTRVEVHASMECTIQCTHSSQARPAALIALRYCRRDEGRPVWDGTSRTAFQANVVCGMEAGRCAPSLERWCPLQGMTQAGSCMPSMPSCPCSSHPCFMPWRQVRSPLRFDPQPQAAAASAKRL